MKKEPLIVFISILFLLVSCRVKDENIESGGCKLNCVSKEKK